MHISSPQQINRGYRADDDDGSDDNEEGDDKEDEDDDFVKSGGTKTALLEEPISDAGLGSLVDVLTELNKDRSDSKSGGFSRLSSSELLTLTWLVAELLPKPDEASESDDGASRGTDALPSSLGIPRG